ncbi:Uncharacterised protein [Yersinia frederiksenii]|nr:Uncharacterised protein [Yersinia frederiksenii]
MFADPAPVLANSTLLTTRQITKCILSILRLLSDVRSTTSSAARLAGV